METHYVLYMYDSEHEGEVPYVPHHEPSEEHWERIILFHEDNYGISLIYYPLADDHPLEIAAPVRGGGRLQGSLSRETMVALRDWLNNVLPATEAPAGGGCYE